MSLQIWLPLTKDTRNQGLCGDVLTESGVSFADGGKLGEKYFSAGTITIPAATSKKIFNKIGMSFAFWLYPIGTSGSSAIMGQEAMSTGNNRMYTLFQYSTPNDLHLSWQDNTATNSAVFLGGVWSGFFPANTWTHCCVTYNGSKAIIYRNGVEYGSSSGTSNRTSFEYNFPIFGASIRRLQDVRIYDHCLSPMEVKELAKGLILHYPLNDKSIESTTNLNTKINMNNSTNSIWGGHSTTTTTYDCTNEPVPFNSGNKIEITYPVGGDTGGGTSVNLGINIPVSSSTTYTLSVYLKASDNFVYWTPNFLYYYGDTAGHGIFNIANKEYIKDGWYRIWGVLTTGSNQTSLNPYFYSYPGENRTYYIGGWQLEQKNHMTPFVSPGTSRNNSIIYDCSGFCNNGTKSGTLNYTSDTPKYNVSTYFPSGTGIFAYPNITLSQFTIAFWGKHSATDKMLMGSNSSVSSTNAIWYWYGDNSFKYPSGEFYYNHNAGSVASLLNKWTHFVATYDGTNITIYRNGINEGSKVLTEPQVMEYLSIGNGYLNSGYWENGHVSDFRLYTTALSASEVLSLYQNSAYIDNSGNVYGAVHMEV